MGILFAIVISKLKEICHAKVAVPTYTSRSRIYSRIVKEDILAMTMAQMIPIDISLNKNNCILKRYRQIIFLHSYFLDSVNDPYGVS